ncbi:MAG: sugar phosphate isomerase/epimerase family protein [Pseudomonadota bacterium]
MAFRHRIGVDLGRRVAIEEGIAWAAANDVKYFDAQIDIAPNAMERFDDATCARIKETCATHGLHLGLHTLSGVNIAEVSPLLRDATDAYLRAYIDLAKRMAAEWVVVHGGYHFTACRELRKQASVERLKRAVGYAEEQGVLLTLENLNGEPERAEVHYMPDNLEDTIWYFDQIKSPNLKWAFTINHAHYDPVGIAGFIDGMDMTLCEEVRIADNNGEYEIHMHPGTGTVDFVDMFRRIEATDFSGHYMCGWGNLDMMLEGRDYLVERAREAGVESAQ